MQTCVLQSEATCVNRVNTAISQVQTTLPGKLDSLRAHRDRARCDQQRVEHPERRARQAGGGRRVHLLQRGGRVHRARALLG
jgi:hypothetical protein